MNELRELAAVRSDVAALPTEVRMAGRRRLATAMTDERKRARRLFRRRLAVAMAVVAAVTASAVVAQGVSVSGRRPGSVAEAAGILDQAAIAAMGTVDLQPDPNQYIYEETLHVTSGLKTRVETWRSVDGSQEGLVSGSRDADNWQLPIPQYRSEQGLAYAPYTVLARLPADPEALLPLLYADPGVANDVDINHSTPDVAVWSLTRSLVARLPSAQRAALFRAAAKVPGIARVSNATDAAGRRGVAIGLYDKRIGRIDFIFDARNYTFLGERIVDPKDGNRVVFNNTVVQTAVVDRVGQRP